MAAPKELILASPLRYHESLGDFAIIRERASNYHVGMEVLDEGVSKWVKRIGLTSEAGICYVVLSSKPIPKVKLRPIMLRPKAKDFETTGAFVEAQEAYIDQLEKK